MNTERLQFTLTAGEVVRYHAAPTVSRQTVAAHTWGVAIILLYLTNGSVEPVLMTEALLHDSAELWTGDIPFVAKRDCPALKAAAKDYERSVRFTKTLASERALRTKELSLLKLADTLEGYLWCIAHEAQPQPVAKRWEKAYAVAKEKLKQIPVGTWARADDLFNNARSLLIRHRTIA
jgi:5'-deoxynucleotidase YfbR-like HD superfamily hydrolase